MKKIILVCGLIAGLIITAMMVTTTAVCYHTEAFESNMVLGYASMLLAFSLIFVGVKNFRDQYNGGVISFGKGFKIGLYITLIASTIYVVVWLIDYYVFMPDFMDRYTAHVLKEARIEGATSAELAKQADEMQSYKDMYKNPVMVILLTYSEVIPVGLVVSLLCALFLKRNTSKQVQTT
ncbi:DUF4199 domain-containing protein [Larkinella sp. GY13]|uniref:DUF4199 domain-containing protein n=1 Tax=Larkinella sp. GY13 TaxID=3453720 RepID=UPI003EEC6250